MKDIARILRHIMGGVLFTQVTHFYFGLLCSHSHVGPGVNVCIIDHTLIGCYKTNWAGLLSKHSFPTLDRYWFYVRFGFHRFGFTAFSALDFKVNQLDWTLRHL